MKERVIFKFLIMVSLIFASCNIKKPLNLSSYVFLNPTEGWCNDSTITINIDAPEQTVGKQNLVNMFITLQVRCFMGYKIKDTLAFDLKFITPNKEEYSDTIKIPLVTDNLKIIKNEYNGIMELSIPYAQGITDMQSGNWRIDINKIPEYGFYDKLIGIGIYLTKEDEQ